MARRRNILSKLGGSLLIAALPIVWFASEWDHERRSRLPDSVTTYRDFLETMPQPARVAIVSVDGQSYLEVNGPLPRGLAFPSGPPVYVFDSGGDLVAWTYDSGDDSAFQSTWKSPEQRQIISATQALKQFAP